MINDVFKDQEDKGIIERIDDNYPINNPHHSYLPHMPVFKLECESTKCRVVYLSNLCQKIDGNLSLSHNQVMHAGPNLNQKISIAITLHRFDDYIICFDIAKASLNIQLSDIDSS